MFLHKRKAGKLGFQTLQTLNDKGGPETCLWWQGGRSRSI